MKSAPMLPPVVALCVVSEGKMQTPFQLRAEHSVFIGTSSNCGLSLHGEGVSGIHCYVRFEEDKIWIEDWMSQSGTLVNGVPITTRVEAQLGDIIQVGNTQIALQDAAQTTASSTRLASTTAASDIEDSELIGSPSSADHSNCTEAIPQDTSSSSGDTTCTAVDEPAASPSSYIPFDCFDANIFETDEDETYDKETVALLHAEIEHLQAALAQRQVGVWDELNDEPEATAGGTTAADDPADAVLARMQELIDEANRSDERVAMLEELLLATELASDAEREERRQLEAWVDDIEQRLTQREAEHQAEIELLREQLARSEKSQERLVQQLRQAAGEQTASQHYHEHLDQLQHDYQKLRQELAESQQQCAKLQQQLSQMAEEPQQALREERIRLAEEQKQIANLKLDLSAQLANLKAPALPQGRVDGDADQRIQALRDHLLQIHQQDQQAAKAASLAGRFKRLWQRVDR